MLRQGRTSSLEAEIWYLPEASEAEHGTPYLEGPFSAWGRTLTARYPFQPVILGARPAWRVNVPEPSLWCPRSPNCYRLGETTQVIGLRDLHVKNDSFYVEDRRWLIRAAQATEGEIADTLADWREADLVPIVPQPSQALCLRALQLGVALIADLARTPAPHRAACLARLSRFASVSLVLVSDRTTRGEAHAAHSHAILGTSVPLYGALSEWGKFALVSEHVLRSGWQPTRRLPVVAARECFYTDDGPGELRNHCDMFQAHLRHGADYAGLWLFRKGWHDRSR